MKIDNRITNYEISNQPSKSSSPINDSQPVLDRREIREKRPDGQDAIVNISQASKEVRLAREVIGSTPDIREDKVAELKAKIVSGNYKTDPLVVANKLVDTLLGDIS